MYLVTPDCECLMSHMLVVAPIARVFFSWAGESRNPFAPAKPWSSNQGEVALALGCSQFPGHPHSGVWRQGLGQS